MIDSLYTLRVTAGEEALETIRRFVEETTATLKLDQAVMYDLLMAVNELATNIVMHGYQGRPGLIEVTIRPLGDTLEVRLRDQAPLFDPTRVAAPDISLPLTLRQPGGLGILLARHFVDQMLHRPAPDGGNELTLIKRGVLRQRS